MRRYAMGDDVETDAAVASTFDAAIRWLRNDGEITMNPIGM